MSRLWQVVLGATLVMIAVAGYLSVRRGWGYLGRRPDPIEVQRWDALVAFSRCLTTAIEPRELDTLDATATDPRVPGSKQAAIPSFNLPDCETDLGVLAAAPAFAPVQPVLQHWLTAEHAFYPAVAPLSTYYTAQDWKSDDYRSAGAKWAAAKAASQEERAAAIEARDRVLPIVRSELHRYQAAYEHSHGRDATWWTIELGLLQQLAADDEKFGDRSKVKAELAAFDAAIQNAPIEVARVARQGYKVSSRYFKNDLLRSTTGSDRAPTR